MLLPTKRLPIPHLLGLTLGLSTFLLTACDGGGGSGGGEMFVQSCSLGCSNGQGASQVICSIDSTFLNQEIGVLFSDPVNIGSVNSTTFQVLNVNTGAVPLGSFLLDPSNARRLIFRPALTLSPSGQLEFGFDQGETYRITIPGSELDPGPYVRSIDGKVNRTRLRCDIVPSGIVDVVPGPPIVNGLFVRDSAGALVNVITNPGATDIAQDSEVAVLFADVMNPLTLFNPANGTSTTVLINVDRDGNPLTVADQTPLAGSFSVLVDQSLSRTQLTFRPVCLPSSGVQGRLIVVSFAPGITDLAGNQLINPGVQDFQPIASTGSELILPDGGEDFTTTTNLNVIESAAGMWGAGRIVPGFGGGSGRHGLLELTPGELALFDTEDETFPATVFPQPGVEHNQITNKSPGTDYNPLDATTWPKIDVTDGVFEFSAVRSDPNSRLVLSGRVAARVFSRGEFLVNGIVDVAGESVPAQRSDEPVGRGGLGGPSGGNGGDGGTRQDSPPALQGSGGIELPPDVTEALTGQVGELVGLGATGGNVPPPTDTGGLGGVNWPTLFPTGNQYPAQGEGMNISDPNACRSNQVGGSGSGGGYALDGGQGISQTVEDSTGMVDPTNLPPDPTTPGGLQAPIEPPDPEDGHFVRKLPSNANMLRGGSGGGGGGTHLFNTTTDGLPIPGFKCGGGIDNYFDNSGGPGGGGGGALQAVSGDRITLGGQILAGGGDGASATSDDPETIQASTPGGGGAGGAVRLQAELIGIVDAPLRIDIDGGEGGVGVAGSAGGDGSPGLVRLEQGEAAQMNPALEITRDSEATKIAPYDPLDPNQSHEWISAGTWTSPRRRPETFSGVVSCWIKPDLADCFLQLDFAEDVMGSDDPDDMGWNMSVVYDDGTGEQVFPYRGIPNDPNFPLQQSIQDTIGNVLAGNDGMPAGSRVVVRFQGAQSVQETLTDPCEVPLTGVDAGILPGSLTPWVNHPAELNEFLPQPNMVRFTVIFDGALAIPGTINGFIKGVDDFAIRATPD